MLDAIFGELAKIIAKEFYDFAKSESSEKLKGLKKSTSLVKSGKGVPESVLYEFEKSFLAALDELKYRSDGYACWRHNQAEEKFYFLLEDRLVQLVSSTDWSKAAALTAEGVRQVEAIGGNDGYNKVINSIAHLLIRSAIRKVIGKPIGKSPYMTIVHSPVIEKDVALEGSNEFGPKTIFFKSKSTGGTEENLLREYKLAKSLVVGSWLNKSAPPSKGPYLKKE